MKASQDKGGAETLLIANYKGELVTVADKPTTEVAEDIFYNNSLTLSSWLSASYNQKLI